MNKEEYKTILKLLEDGKTDDLKRYLDERINSKYINSVRKTIVELIDNDCDKEYPSYYARTHLHSGVIKLYKGFYTEMGKGFIISHRNSNAFQLYDRSILTPKIINMLEGSYEFIKEEARDMMTKSINHIFTDLSQQQLEPLFFKDDMEEDILVRTKDGYELTVPSKYYTIAHKLLGEDALEYIFDNGLYFDSPKGKAFIMKKVKK